MNSPKRSLMISGIVIEIAGIVLLGRSIVSDTSPVFGIVLLVIGLILVMATISKKDKPGP